MLIKEALISFSIFYAICSVAVSMTVSVPLRKARKQPNRVSEKLIRTPFNKRAMGFLPTNEVFLATIGIGTPPQLFNVLVDTGSSDVWVADSACTSQYCHGTPRNFFNAKLSSTFHNVVGQKFSLLYSDGGKESGYIGNVSATVPQSVPLRMFGQNFGLVNDINEQDKDFAADGILGLSFPVQQGIAGPNPTRNLFASSHLDRPMFTVVLYARDPNDPTQVDTDGLLTFGGFDGRHCKNNLQMFPTIADQSQGWAIQTSRIQFGSVIDQGNFAVADTGTTGIGVPKRIASRIADLVGAKYVDKVQLYSLACNANVPDLFIDVGNRRIVIDNFYLKVWDGEKCQLFMQATDDDFWVLGLPLFMSNCVVHDLSNQQYPMLGFADIKGQ